MIFYPFRSAVSIGSGLVARLDRSTGNLIFVGPTGSEIGRYPAFDPIAAGQATEQKP